MFIGHPDAGDRSAIIYSIIVSCQRRGIDPLAYMRDVLSRLPSMTNQDDQPGRPDTGPLATSGSPRLVGNYALHPQASLM